MIVPVRETGIEVRLEGRRSTPHVPRSIRELRSQQKPDAAIERRIAACDHAGLGEGGQRLAGRVGIARERWDLRPASIRTLFGKQTIGDGLHGTFVNAHHARPSSWNTRSSVVCGCAVLSHVAARAIAASYRTRDADGAYCCSARIDAAVT